MTLIERLAREAVPAHPHLVGSVAAKMRELVEVTAEIGARHCACPSRLFQCKCADEIRALLINEEPTP
jgi:hypothetical protein